MGSLLSGLLDNVDLSDPGSLKRALAGAMGGVATLLLVFLNPWLETHGLPKVSDAVLMTGIGAIASKVVTYLLQSGAKAKAQVLADAKAAGATAAAAVVPGPAADAVVDAAAKGATP